MPWCGVEVGFIACTSGSFTLAYELDGDDVYVQLGKHLLIISRARHERKEPTQNRTRDRGVQKT